MRRPAFLALLLAAAPAAAHIVEIWPVRVVLRADGGLLRADFTTRAEPWRLLAAPLPGEPDFEAKAEAYLAGHFTLSVDGSTVPPRVTGGRAVRPLWGTDRDERVVVHAVYRLPPGGRAAAVRSAFFHEDHAGLEGRGFAAPDGYVRDFRAIVSWPGGGRDLTVAAPSADLPAGALRRSAAARWGESAAAGIAAFLSTAAGAALLAALLLFVPGRRAALAVAAAALVAAAAGAAAPWGEAAAARGLWGALALAGLPSLLRRVAVPWSAAAFLGATCAARLWLAEGLTRRAATGFEALSWPAFWLGAAALAPAGVLAARGVALFYRRHFRHLTADELSRQSLFHRQVAARLLAIAGLYGLFSPLWGGRP